MVRWGRFAAAYACMGVIAAVIAVIWREGSPLTFPDPWLKLESGRSHAYSIVLGITFGVLVVVLTRPLVTRFAWARALHRELRPLAREISMPGIATVAVLSAIGEELFFRSLLQPFLGLIPQALLFGMVHQVRGVSRWVWVIWATLVGLVLGVVFELTGSLLGPMVAHALINGFNLQYLKSHDPEPSRKRLGGLLGQRG